MLILPSNTVLKMNGRMYLLHITVLHNLSGTSKRVDVTYSFPLIQNLKAYMTKSQLFFECQMNNFVRMLFAK